jgi:hypothetical protein
MKISKIEAPDKGEINTYFIAGDWHTEAMSQSSFKIMLAMARKIPKKRRKLIINGDFLDAAHLMARNPQFKKWKGREDGMDEFFIPLSEDELNWGNRILDILQKNFNEIIYIEGNHCWRYRDFMSKCPADYAHNFDYRSKLQLTTRGISVVDYNDWLDIGDKLSITHGAYHGSTCHKKHYEASGGKSVIFSHIHYVGCKAFSVRGNTHHVWSLPAFCDLNPEYIKNRETNWSNGFGVINIKDNSNFNFNIFQIWDDQLVLPDGKVISAR